MHRRCPQEKISKESVVVSEELHNSHHQIVQRYLDAIHHMLRKRNSKRQPPIAIKPTIRGVLTQDELEDDDRDIEEWHAIVHAVAELHKEQEAFEQIVGPAEFEQTIREAYALIRILNQAYGWEPGEPDIANRMLGSDVQAALVQAISSGCIDKRTHAMINAMRSVAHGAHTGSTRLEMVAAVRNLVGGLTTNEATLLADAKRLHEEQFVEMVHYADELAIANQRTPPLKHEGRHAELDPTAEQALGIGRVLR